MVRSVAASTLWPDLDPAKAEANLRVNLTYLLKVLEPDRARSEAPFFVRTEGGLLVLESSVDIDVEAFDRWIASVQRNDEAGARAEALTVFVDELALCRVEFLEGIDAEWIEPVRPRRQSLALGAMCRRRRAPPCSR